MDDEEYKRLIDKRRGVVVRFSDMKSTFARSGERRMTIFNPNDPNNALQSHKFLKSDNSPKKADEEDFGEEPIEELFEENWIVKIPKVTIPINECPVEEGYDVF